MIAAPRADFVVTFLLCLGMLGGCEPATQAPSETAHARPLLTPDGPDLWAHPEIKAELLLDREVARHSSDGGGVASVQVVGQQASEPILAGSRASFTIDYVAGPEGIARGGAVFLQVSPFWGWEAPQVRGGQAGGFTTVSTEAEGVTLEPRPLGQGLMQIEIGGRALLAGEKIRIDYGVGPAQARVDRFAESGSRFWIAVDGDGDGVRKLIRHSPSVDIVARQAARLHLALPGSAAPETVVRLTIALLDTAGNSGMPFSGRVELEVADDVSGMTLPAEVVFVPADLGRRTIEVAVGEAGIYRVSGVARRKGSDQPGPAAQSNPLVVDTAQEGVLLWGDLQVHTQLSDGSGTTLESLEYARDAAGLDVVALTDHDHWGLEALDDFPTLWQAQLAEVEKFHVPGRFVTIPAFEWTNWVEGHRHVLFFDGATPRLLSSLDPRFDTPDKLWAALKGENAMTIAHHSAGGPVPIDWSIRPDEVLEPVTEIVSVHGSSESADSSHPIYKAKPGNYVRDALDLGYRLGFLGSSDGHDGHPGLSQIANGGKSGLAGIWTQGEEPRSRAAVAAALRSRNVYATSGPRIYLEVTLDGLPMGSVLDGAAAGEDGGTQILRWMVAAEAPVERIEIFRRDAAAVSLAGDGSRDLAGEIELPSLAPGDWLYLRVLQRDGGTAWASPFFVLP
ncbi:MAG: CehA/McbA family metallohydrolase [Deltaproteobacteria bacterium]